MADTAVTQISRNGILDLDSSAVAASAGNTDSWISNGGNEFIYVNNNSGGNLIVTLQYNGPGGTVDGGALTNRTVTIATGKRALIGGFPAGLYASAAANRVTIGWSTHTSVTWLPVGWAPNG